MRALAALALAAALLAGCGQDDPQAGYCEVVEEEAPQLTRAVDERGTAGFLESIPALERLAEAAPDDVRPHWDTFLGAVEDLRAALDDAGVDPADVDGKLPAGLPADQRRAIRDAATMLQSPEVRSAAQHVEQHAKDVCHMPLL